MDNDFQAFPIGKNGPGYRFGSTRNIGPINFLLIVGNRRLVTLQNTSA